MEVDKKTESRCRSTVLGYFAEIRTDGEPFPLAQSGPLPPLVVTHKWKRLPTRSMFATENPTEAIRNAIWGTLAHEHGVMTYPAARAVIAKEAAALHHQQFQTQFRLVQVEFEYSYSVTVKGHGQPEEFGFEAERKVEFTPATSDTP